jgi:hypothetical protein
MATVITKDYTVTKAKAEAKAKIMDIIYAALENEFGGDSVAWVRTETSDKSGTNFIGVIADELEVDGNTVPMVVGINASAKDPVERVTKTKTYGAFDFVAAKELYERKQESNAEKAKAKAEAKAKKIANKDVTEF